MMTGQTNITATETLRRLLDERVVEWGDDGYPTTCTVWASDGIVWHGLWRDDCIELIAHVTPEQAVDATLGPGTCEVECFDDGMDEGMDGEWFAYATATWHLSCGHEVYGSERPRYCPNCGRKVES